MYKNLPLMLFICTSAICLPSIFKAGAALEDDAVPATNARDGITVKAIKADFAANEPVVVIVEIENRTQDALRLMDPIVSGLRMEFPVGFSKHNMEEGDAGVNSIFGSARMYTVQPGDKLVRYVVLDEYGKFIPGDYAVRFRLRSKCYSGSKVDAGRKLLKAVGEIDFSITHDLMTENEWDEYLEFLQELPDITPSELASISSFVYHSDALKFVIESVKDRDISSVYVLNAIRMSKDHGDWCTRGQIVDLIRHGHTQALAVGLELISSRKEQIPRSLLQVIVDDHTWARARILMRHYEAHGISDHVDLVAQFVNSDNDEVRSLARKVLDGARNPTDVESETEFENQ